MHTPIIYPKIEQSDVIWQSACKLIATQMKFRQAEHFSEHFLVYVSAEHVTRHVQYLQSKIRTEEGEGRGEEKGREPETWAIKTRPGEKLSWLNQEGCQKAHYLQATNNLAGLNYQSS